MNELKKDSKLRLSLNIPLLLTSANRYTPIIEYRYSKSKSKPPTLARAGRVKMKVLKTNLKFLALLTSLNIRVILKALTIEVAPPSAKLVITDKRALNREPITMMKSNLFQLS